MLAFDETVQAQRSFEVQVELDFRKIADELQRGALTHGGAIILGSATLVSGSLRDDLANPAVEGVEGLAQTLVLATLVVREERRRLLKHPAHFIEVRKQPGAEFGGRSGR